MAHNGGFFLQRTLIPLSTFPRRYFFLALLTNIRDVIKIMNNFKHEGNLLFGGIEAGGTKFNCVVGNAMDIKDSACIPTTTPAETLARVSHFFTQAASNHGALSALGIGSFGPVDLDKNSPQYGYITATPKKFWAQTDIVGYFKKTLQIPIALETDVNAAAIGEYTHGAAKGIDNFVYVTIGTGIGGGVVSQGTLLQGDSHPEIGHMLIPHSPEQDDFNGVCPFHGACLEGLASGPAIEARWKTPSANLGADHPAWELQANYLALMCMNLTVCYSPSLIILGGGVMNQKHLFSKICDNFKKLINGYNVDRLPEQFGKYIIGTGLGNQSGVIGTLALAATVVELVQKDHNRLPTTR